LRERSGSDFLTLRVDDIGVSLLRHHLPGRSARAYKSRDSKKGTK
jgi:hypothetical protein